MASTKNDSSHGSRRKDPDGERDGDLPDKGTGIFKVRPSPKPSAATAGNPSSFLQNRITELGVSTDSTEQESSSMDLPTITVSEDELHDTMSDVSSNEGSELEDDGAGTAIVSNLGPSVSARGSREDISGKPPVTKKLKKASSNPSIATKTSIRSKVKVLGGKVKEVWGGISSGMHMRRSPDDVTSEVSKILSSASPSAGGKGAASDSGTADVVTIEVKKLLEIMKKDQELRRKEEEMKKLEQLKKKEDEAKKREEEQKRKMEEKKMKSEEERLGRKEKELQKREKEEEEKFAKKEMELVKKEKDICTREALLERRMAEFDRRCKELDIQMKAEKARIDQEKENLRRERTSLSGDNRTSRDRFLTCQDSKESTLRPTRSEDHLTAGIIDPSRPPRRRESQENLTNLQWSDYRKKLPPPPRPPLPRPSTEEKTLLPPRVSSPTSTSASMKTALTSPQSGTNTLFRVSPTSSSSSTIFCSDVMDIPLDDAGPPRVSVERDQFDAKLFYAMIVSEWRKRHPRRILRETKILLPPSRSSRSRLEQQKVLLEKRQEVIWQHRDYFDPYASRNVSRSRSPVSHFSVPSSDVIYAVPRKTPRHHNLPTTKTTNFDAELRSYNYRLKKKNDFYSPFIEENPYDELIFPIQPRVREEDLELYPVVPPRMKRGRSKSSLRLADQERNFDRISPTRHHLNRDDDKKMTDSSHTSPVTVDFITSKVHHLTVA